MCIAVLTGIVVTGLPVFACLLCSAVLRRLRDVHKGLFNEFPGVLRDMRPHYTKVGYVELHVCTYAHTHALGCTCVRE